MMNSLQHSNRHVMYIVTFVVIVKRYADNQRTRDSRLHYLEMWSLGKQSLNAKAEKKTRKNILHKIGNTQGPWLCFNCKKECE